MEENKTVNPEKSQEEMVIIYPEIKEELEWNFEFYQKESLYNHGIYFLLASLYCFFPEQGHFFFLKKRK